MTSGRLASYVDFQTPNPSFYEVTDGSWLLEFRAPNPSFCKVVGGREKGISPKLGRVDLLFGRKPFIS
jgi:hypothetical protein